MRISDWSSDVCSFDLHGFQAAQHAIGAPVFGQLDGRAHQVALVFFQLGFEAFLKGKGIGRGTGETGQDFVLVKAAYFAGRTLDDDVAQGDLAVRSEEHTSELQSLMRISYAVFCLKKTRKNIAHN